MVKLLIEESVENARRRLVELRGGMDRYRYPERAIGEMKSCEATIKMVEQGPTSWDDWAQFGAFRCWFCNHPVTLDFSQGLERPDQCQKCYHYQLDETVAKAIRAVKNTTNDPKKIWRMLKESTIGINYEPKILKRKF